MKRKKYPEPKKTTMSFSALSSLGVFTDLYQNVNENTMRSNIRNQQKRRSN